MLNRIRLYWQTASPAERAWAAVALACLLACAALVLSLRACDAPAEPTPLEQSQDATDASRTRDSLTVSRTRSAVDSTRDDLRDTRDSLRAPLPPPPATDAEWGAAWEAYRNSR